MELTFALRGSLMPELDGGGRRLRLKDAGDQFGWSMAIGGDTVVVRANREDGVGGSDR